MIHRNKMFFFLVAFTALLNLGLTPKSGDTVKKPIDQAKPSPKKGNEKTTSKKQTAEKRAEKPETAKKTKDSALDDQFFQGTFAIVNLAGDNPKTITELLNLYKILQKSSLGDGLEETSLQKALLGAAHDTRFKNAQETMKRGKRLYGALKFSEAISVFEKAKTMFLRSVHHDKAADELISTLSYLMLSLNSLGKTPEAREVARTLSFLSRDSVPEKVPSPLWKQLKPKRKPNTRILKIRAPKDARVFVDFTLLKDGDAPEADGDVLWSTRIDTGLHHVIVQAKGLRKFYTQVQAGPANVSLVTTMEPEPKDPHPNIRSTVIEWLSKKAVPTTKELKALARKARVQRLVMVKKEEIVYSLQLFEAKNHQLYSPTVTYTPPIDEKDKEKLIKWGPVIARSLKPKEETKKIPLEKSTKKAAAEAGKKKPLSEKPKKVPPIWKRWYFWVTLGAVGIVAVVFAVRGDPENKVEIEVTRP